MRMRPLLAFVFVAAFAGSDRTPRALAAAPIACEALGQMTIANGTVLSAESLRGFTPPNATNPNPGVPYKTLPDFCRVALKLSPTSDSDIRVEIWLPASGWNKKLQAVGNGGLGGAMPY